MRAQEFLAERVNLDIFKPDTSIEKTVDVAGIGPVILKLVGKPASMDIPYVQIMAYAPDGDEMGYFRFHAFGLDDKPYVTAGNIRVHREYQRRGVATAVYQWMRELGNDIRPSTSRTDQGQAMWSGFEKKHSLSEGVDFTNAVNSIEKLIKQNNIEFAGYEDLLKFVASRKFLQPQRNDQQFINDVARSVLRRLHQTQLNEINDEDELSVSQRIQDYFTDRGYGYLGEGRDQIAFLSPRGTVVKVLGIGEDEREDIVKTYVGFFLRNQRNPHYPRIYNAGDFEVDGETYFVYEMEYLYPVAGEDRVLEYIEDLMSALPRGEQALAAFYKNKKRPPELSEQEVDGLVMATQDLEDAIGGQAPLDLRSIENLGRRKDGQIVIIDPFSL
jgi:GNAT superfamily N-acetyltransferase